MTFIWIMLGLILIVIAMDLTIRRVYHYPKKPHETTPAAFGLLFEEIRFPTRNNRRLYGWWVPAGTRASDSTATLILVHGWGRNVGRMMPYIEELHSRGYDLLAFDLRAHGSSDPEQYPNLLKFSEDIRAAVDFVASRTSGESERIGVIGLSVGGGATIHAAAADNRIKHAVTVGALAHPVDVMRLEFTSRHVPYVPLGWLMLAYLQLRMGVNFDRIAPVNVIQHAASRILLVHGEQDVVVPVEQGKRLRDAGNPVSTSLWTVPGRGHSDCHSHPDFWSRIESFLRR